MSETVTQKSNKEITLRELMDERDKRYEERFKAQQEALKLALAAKNTYAGLAVSLSLGLTSIALAIFALMHH
jgi:hypothetical protein